MLTMKTNGTSTAKSAMSLKLLDHVELLTQHRDTALLDRSVISSLKELLGVERVRLIELCRLDGILYFSISAWNEDDRILSPEDLAEDRKSVV